MGQSGESRADIHVAAFFIVATVAAFAHLGHREVRKLQDFERSHPYTTIARRLARMPRREWCDDEEAPSRNFAAGVVDQFGAEIRALWGQRGAGNEPKFSLMDLGVAQLRVSPKLSAGSGFDSSAWSWGEAYGLIRRAQSDPGAADNTDRWRDIDSMVRFLIEKDYARIAYGKKFAAPELTEHQFQPNAGVVRSGEREFTVRLDPGEFKNHEEALRHLLETEWQGEGYHVRIQWGPGAEAYQLRAHSDSNRSFVNHRTRTLEIANLAWTKTVAHELGHVLGFDDHYYNVWDAQHCYYSQESRLGDLMSNSEHGVVTARHWEILNHAYPWRAEPVRTPFNYVYGK